MGRWWRSVMGIGALVVLGGVELVLGAQDWYRQPAGGGRLFSGDALWGGLTRNLACAVIAAALLMIVLGPLGRRLLALLVGLLGAAMTWLGAVPPTPDPVSDDEPVRRGRAIIADVLTGSNIAYAAVGALVALVAVGLIIRPGGRRERIVHDPLSAPRRSAEQWALVDRGLDPTEDL